MALQAGSSKPAASHVGIHASGAALVTQMHRAATALLDWPDAQQQGQDTA